MQYCNIVDCDLHLKTHCTETMCQSKLSQDIGSSITQRLHGNNLWERFSNNHNCSDERVWPKIEKSAKLSSRQSVESSDGEKPYSGDN